MSNHELECKIRELRQLLSLIEEAEAEAETIKDSIKAFMGDSEELHAGEYKVTWKPVKSTRIDTGALRKALPDVAQLFTRETISRRFCIQEEKPLAPPARPKRDARDFTTHTEGVVSE